MEIRRSWVQSMPSTVAYVYDNVCVYAYKYKYVYARVYAIYIGTCMCMYRYTHVYAVYIGTNEYKNVCESVGVFP